MRARTRIGYLVPEFPGQTHSFFWREIRALRDLGVSVDLISTRPPAHASSHEWAHEARQATTYLTRPDAATAFTALMTLLRGVANGSTRRALTELRSCLDAETGTHGALARLRACPRQAALLLFGAELAGFARRRGWSHVHVHSAADAAQLALYAHRLTGLGYSFTLHGPLSDYGGNQPAKWRHAEFAIVITEPLRDAVRSQLGDDQLARTAIAPMGVEVETFSRERPYRPWDGAAPARIFSCGRLNASKGHDDLVRALAQLRRDGIDADLTIAGEDEDGGAGYRTVLDDLVRREGLTGHVVLLGSVSESRVRLELSRAHVFALASHAEPLGVAIMEAMSMELPVVVTESPGVRELILDGVSGRLVPPSDPAAMASALKELLSSPVRARSLGHGGRERVATAFTSRRSALQLVALLSGEGKDAPPQ